MQFRLAASRALALATAATIAAGCGSSQNGGAKPGPQPAGPQYRATIRWTSHGVPHITAADLGGLAFGQGYAFATQHVCVLADQVLKLRSERAKMLGPGEGDANIESDFGWLALEVREQAERARASASREGGALLRGFVAGFNRYLAETKPADLPPDCAGAAWVRPIDELDLLSHWLQLSAIGSTAYFLPAIAAAAPPGKTAARTVPAPDLRRSDAPASNGWAIGAERAAGGRGMLVANPHFPWESELRFFESHLTIPPGSPDAVDVYGATLLGLPMITIGFTETHAWTHTFSSSSRFVIYRLELVPNDPTRYQYGEETRALESRELSIHVRNPDGSFREVKRRAYRSHYGPVIANDLLPWSTKYVYTLRDVAGGGVGGVDQYLAMARAKDLAGFEAAMARWQATGFVNTIYADREGNALYVDGSAVPDLPPAALGALKLAHGAIPALAEAWKRGVVIADGSNPLFELANDPESARPFAVAYERAPRLLRRDFVMNANDPHWLTNPAAPLEGFSPLYGEARQAPSARTRMNLHLLQATGADAPAGADGKFTQAELEAAILDDRAMTSEVLREAVIERCRAAARRNDPEKARLGLACEALAAWDGHYHTKSRGAVVWREWLSAHKGSPYAQPFDPARPVETPSGLAERPIGGEDRVVAALWTAMERLERAGVDLRAPLGDVQWADKRGRKIGVPGSSPAEGSTNPAMYSTMNTTLLPRTPRGELVNPDTGLARGGYPVNYGTSFLMVVGFGDAGPAARALLTYSASSDPRSPHFADQTELWSRKQWRPALFRAADIQADPQLRVQEICAPGC